eukprot:CAMPEP_0178463216 /NCGR_PEP_ID=MMETSP0689_2-20121128/50221_1 /TAXON_ID=160604 /ORGANISM="Amphidinium massartii, Strain CS-259" /LENGTH=338 /DNA_ID=CAMNT_0020090097 /DNA_START=36 /DNA_END=1049 /DNA_ORIENTATION=+
MSACELVVLAADAFIKVVSLSPEAASFSSTYAVHLAALLDGDARLQPTDVDPAVNCDILVADIMSPFGKRQQNTFVGKFFRKSEADLEKEMWAGKCHLAQDVNCEVYRVVRLVVLRLLNAEGHVCVKIGRVEKGSSTAKFQLPGRKIEASEGAVDAVTALLREEFSRLADHARLDHVETVVEDEASASFGLPTRYIKTVQTAVLEGELIGHEGGATTHMTGTPIQNGGSFSSLILQRAPATVATAGSYAAQNADSQTIHSALSIEDAFAHKGTHKGEDAKGIVNLYKWVAPADYAELSSKCSRVEIEAVLMRTLREVSGADLYRLLDWSVRAAESEAG